jgi:hypothetical protein
MLFDSKPATISGDDMIVRIKDSGFLYTDKTRRLVRMVPVSDESILYVAYQNEKFYYTKWDENIVLYFGQFVLEF